MERKCRPIFPLIYKENERAISLNTENGFIACSDSHVYTQKLVRQCDPEKKGEIVNAVRSRDENGGTYCLTLKGGSKRNTPEKMVIVAQILMTKEPAETVLKYSRRDENGIHIASETLAEIIEIYSHKDS